MSVTFIVLHHLDDRMRWWVATAESTKGDVLGYRSRRAVERRKALSEIVAWASQYLDAS
jgi:hypothetical protein